ncbi:MAG: hypothetical protein ACOC2W_04350, partial [bacterium]
MNILHNDKLKELQRYASASIIENEDGSFTMSPKDTSAIYLTILSLNKNNIQLLKNFTPIDYNILNQKEYFYSFKTSMFNTFISNYTKASFYFNKNDKRGGSGNISLSFPSILKDDKIINQDMFNIINKAEIKIILIKDDNKYILDINNIDDWNNFINVIIKNYKPIRLFLNNVSFPECNNFYLKPINAYFNKIYDNIVGDFIIKNKLKKVKSKFLREKFNFDISNYVSDISNNNFFVKINNGVLEKLYIFE